MEFNWHRQIIEVAFIVTESDCVDDEQTFVGTLLSLRKPAGHPLAVQVRLAYMKSKALWKFNTWIDRKTRRGEISFRVKKQKGGNKSTWGLGNTQEEHYGPSAVDKSTLPHMGHRPFQFFGYPNRFPTPDQWDESLAELIHIPVSSLFPRWRLASSRLLLRISLKLPRAPSCDKKNHLSKEPMICTAPYKSSFIHSVINDHTAKNFGAASRIFYDRSSKDSQLQSWTYFAPLKKWFSNLL